ncbi:DUF4179 domain-containing protein [Lysinibacillus sp. NPDC096418]|uniref:DUF4179 domain-containing protein n=1 Tax=Lysinibacillus sp. NPDC096418 TaxID=3364138 RepID=UPI00380C3642
MKQINDQDYEVFVKELECVPVPHDALSEARTASFLRRKKERVRRKRALKSAALIAVLVLIFVVSIRVSPVFASTVAKIPGFAPIVDMITYDKGIEDILSNDYFEEMGITKTKNGLTFTLAGVIADETGMVLSYQLSAPYNIHELETKNVEILQNGKPVIESMTYGWASIPPTKTIESTIQLMSTNRVIDYSNPNFELQITFKDEHLTSFVFPFSIEKAVAKSKEYKINDVVEIDGQKIIIESLKISPLRTELQLTASSSNSMRILGFETIEVFDERGEEWGSIKNGFSGTGTLLEGKVSYFIQSNYFREPKSLTIRLGKVQALPKGQDYIDVDFLAKKVLYAPKFEGLAIRVGTYNTIEVKVPTALEDRMLNHFYQAVDANGEIYHPNESSFLSPDKARLVQSTYTFDMPGAVNPVRIYFHEYENYLQGEAEIKVPLQ